MKRGRVKALKAPPGLPPLAKKFIRDNPARPAGHGYCKNCHSSSFKLLADGTMCEFCASQADLPTLVEKRRRA